MPKFPVATAVSDISHVLLGFQGWNDPWDDNAGQKLGPTDPSTLAKLFRAVEKDYRQKSAGSGPKLAAAAYATDTWDEVKSSAIAFVKAHIPSPKKQERGAKLVIYGYSWGGDTAVELCRDLKKSNYTIDLLVTVDAALGPFSGHMVVRDMIIPTNVVRNVNYIAKNPKSGALSRGVKHYPVNKEKTKVENKVIKGVSHGQMDEHLFDETKTLMIEELTSGS